MTSKKRKNIRYIKRKQLRKRQKDRYSNCDNFNLVFSYEHLYNSYKKCKLGVGWKASTQNYILNAPLFIYLTYELLQKGTFKSDGFYLFNVNERGKIRHIKSVTIKLRIVQRCLCDYALVPMLKRTFIYDNGASLLNKGYTFSINRCKTHLQKFYKKHKNNGYILTFDFSKFFDNISHKLVKQILLKNFTDKKILLLSFHFIDMFGLKGLGLGSQISQILALAAANLLDHFIKLKLKIKYYGRYMDDGYLIHQNKEYLKFCLKEIQKLCNKLEIKLNSKKTQIIKLSHGFTFLKTRFYITNNGKIIKKIYPKSITKIRKKLKIFHNKLLKNLITIQDIYLSLQSWNSYASNFNSYYKILKVKKLYNQLFIYNWLNSKHQHLS